MYMHLKDNNKSIKDSDVKILDREDRWFERIVKEAIFVKLEQPSLRQGLSASYNAVLSSLAQQFRPNSHSDCNSPIWEATPTANQILPQCAIQLNVRESPQTDESTCTSGETS